VRRGLAALALAVALAALARLALDGRGRTAVEGVRLPAPAAVAPSGTRTPEETRRPAGARKAASVPRAPATGPVPAASDPPVQRVRLRGHLRRPDGGELTVERAELAVYDATGARFDALVLDDNDYAVEGLAPGAVEVELRAAGFAPLLERFELPAGAAEVERDFRLEPPGWLEVGVETPAGRPYRELAAALGWEPAQAFSGAFQARASPGPPADAVATPEPADEPRHGRFFPLGERERDRADRSERCIGHLALEQPPPVWVEARYASTSLGWRYVPPGAHEVVFELGLEQLERSLAALRLRVVASGSGEPLADARVTLQAEHSRLRRAEHGGARPDARGDVAFERLVPGDYDLDVDYRGEASLRARLALAAGEDRDLGRVELPLGAPLRIAVRDAEGQGVPALIEVGPHRPGLSVDEVFGPQKHSTDGCGAATLPRPAVPTVVRARFALARPAAGGRVRLELGPPSASVLLDPREPLPGELVLVLHGERAVEVVLGARSRGAARVLIEDALGLVVAAEPVAGRDAVAAELPPGRYRAVALDAAGGELAAAALLVDPAGTAAASAVLP